MKPVVSLLLVSVLIGACAALAATVICNLTSAALSPTGGAVLGVAFGLTGGNLTGQRSGGSRSIGTALLRGVVAGATSALVIMLMQR